MLLGKIVKKNSEGDGGMEFNTKLEEKRKINSPSPTTEAYSPKNSPISGNYSQLNSTNCTIVIHRIEMILLSN